MKLKPYNPEDTPDLQLSLRVCEKTATVLAHRGLSRLALLEFYVEDGKLSMIREDLPFSDIELFDLNYAQASDTSYFIKDESYTEPTPSVSVVSFYASNCAHLQKFMPFEVSYVSQEKGYIFTKTHKDWNVLRDFSAVCTHLGLKEITYNGWHP